MFHWSILAYLLCVFPFCHGQELQENIALANKELEQPDSVEEQLQAKEAEIHKLSEIVKDFWDQNEVSIMCVLLILIL